MSVIQATELTKRYDNTLALDELTLSIPASVVYGYLGPNGAGKTTTMRILTTLTQPTSGTASINDTPIADRTAVTRQIGYLSESPPLYYNLTGSVEILNSYRFWRGQSVQSNQFTVSLKSTV